MDQEFQIVGLEIPYADTRVYDPAQTFSIGPDAAARLSMAISMKRIADVLERAETSLRAPGARENVTLLKEVLMRLASTMVD